MAEQPSFPGFEQSSREQRIAEMDEEILDVTRAARVLGVSSKTVYSMARQGKIPPHGSAASGGFPARC